MMKDEVIPNKFPDPFDMHLQAEASCHPIFFNKTSLQTYL